MKICYKDRKFTPSSLLIIQQADEIIQEYQEDGLNLTLRQLYYQFVSRDLMANKQSEYKRLGSIINDARLAGHIDWDAIEDRTRGKKSNTHWKDPGHIINACRWSFQLDRWEGQPYRPEVWIEKEALSGVISSICDELDVTYFACKGYASASEMWRASRRFKKYRDQNQIPIIIHLGDHDPSGLDMTEDIWKRQDIFIGDMKVNRIALNFDQIEEYRPPPNPTKLTDSRAKEYMNQYGNSSWELDALEPRVIRQLIRDTVTPLIDQDKMDVVLAQEQEYKDVIEKVAEKWRDL